MKAINDYFHPTKGRMNKDKNNITTPELILHSHAFEVKFLNGNPNPERVAENEENTYNNYFIGKDPEKWGSHCNIYNAVTYKNIYPNIDVRYYTGTTGLKYDF